MENKKMVNLGAGGVCYTDWENVDIVERPGINTLLDLRNRPWPWLSDSVDIVMAYDVLEHLNDTVAFMDECWRIIRVGGELRIRVPRFDSLNAWLDPTHVRAFAARTFEYFDPDCRASTYQYTSRLWRILSVKDEDNILCALTPRK